MNKKEFDKAMEKAGETSLERLRSKGERHDACLLERAEQISKELDELDEAEPDLQDFPCPISSCTGVLKNGGEDAGFVCDKCSKVFNSRREWETEMDNMPSE
ncbi:hypothetical protein KKD84_02855 [Patescibacteria group bacterium]|nr:hypothetical protein [Patescibacteria group bacterium]